MRLSLTPSLALLRTQTDARLVALAASGSEAAFSALVERHRRDVQRACARILPESRAEDAAQQVFLAAWKALRRGDEVRDVRPWLLRIARNTSLNALRVQGYDYDELRDSLSAGEAPQAELERREVVRRTLAGLAALPDRQREALLRSAVAGASHADIARDLGLSEGATRQLVLRARSALRAAASAITPMPLVTAAAAATARGGAVSGPTVERIAEIAAGGGVAGASALLAKAGTVAVLAGGVVAGPAIVDRAGGGDRSASGDGGPPAAAAAAPVVEADEPGTAAAGRIAAPAAGGDDSEGRHRRGRSHGRHGSGDDRSGHRDDDDDDRSGRRGGEDDDHGDRSGSDSDDDRRGSDPGDDRTGDDGGQRRRRNRGGDGASGSGGDDSSGSEDDSGGGDDSSGSGSGEDDTAEVAPLATPEADDDSGSGSDDSGSDSSGSDDSGSGSGDEPDEPELPDVDD